MVRDIIKYDGIDYWLTTKYIENIYETTIVCIYNNDEVYSFKTNNTNKCRNKYYDILNNPEKYLSKEIIDNRLKLKEKPNTTIKYIREKFKEGDFTENQLLLLRLAFKLVNDVVEIQRVNNSDVYIINELYALEEKLGIYDLLE